MTIFKSICRSRRELAAAAALTCLTVGGAALVHQPTSAPTQNTTDATAEDVKPLVRGGRYCEIMIVRRNAGKNEAEVWSTQGISACPKDCKAVFDAAAIKTETKAQRVVINGPKIWLPNSPAPTPPAESRRRFGGIEMGLVATLEVKRGDGDPLKERVVPRKTTNTFKGGEEVYELISPDGVVYVMHSMSLSEEPDVKIADLATLESRLRLPRGWKYRARLLEADLSLAPGKDDTVVVLQDRLKNTYQRR
ncbi:MAG: hypothetical protein SFY69_04485 [Planctomycetota bacterium]|nr:hypothetical protein [Planctomycetota bacterium]